MFGIQARFGLAMRTELFWSESLPGSIFCAVYAVLPQLSSYLYKLSYGQPAFVPKRPWQE